MARKKYTLVGVDGNAFAVMGTVCKWIKARAREWKWNPCKVREVEKAYLDDAMSGDYNHLLYVSREMTSKLNQKEWKDA